MANVVNQIRLGNHSLIGLMIESKLVAGKQTIPADLAQLKNTAAPSLTPVSTGTPQNP